MREHGGDMSKARLTRREFLKTGAACTALAAAAGCASTERHGHEGRASPLDDVVIDPATVVGKKGFFRVGKSERGRWWLIRPDARPMLYRGVCALWIQEAAGREASKYRAFWEKQNGKDIDKFAAHCFDLLRERGFNAMGEWSTEELWNRGWPFTMLIHVRQARKESNLTGKLVDVFDQQWRTAYEAMCKATCAGLADKKDLVGYFVDNEGGFCTSRRDFVWGQDQGPMVDKNVLGQAALLLQMFLTTDPKHPGQKVAWDWVLERHGGSVAQAARDWGADFDTPEKLRELHDKGMVLASAGYRRDHEAFTAHYVQEYFRFTSEAIRRYDPNHLLLGARHGGTEGDEMMKAYDKRYVDVVSWNCYNLNFWKRCDEYARGTGMPQLNGEFSWASGGFLDWEKLQSRKAFSPEELESCRRRGRATLEKAFTHPALIGYTWYKFCWNPVNPDQPGYGLIDDNGQTSRFNEPLMKEVNARLEGITCGRIAPFENAG